jgi:hypothetical protein
VIKIQKGILVTVVFCLTALFACIINGCGAKGGRTPKESVIKLFGAMERDDRGAILPVIDLPQLMNQEAEDYALQTDKPRIFHNPDDLLNDLTGDGLTKKRWFSMQRVIGNTEIMGDSATVEVSFINKETDTQYYTKFGLHKKNDVWKIYTFRKIDKE